MKNMTQGQSGQVLAEAVIVLLLLVAMLTSIHLTGRLQYQWLQGYMAVQKSATALGLGHDSGPVSIQKKAGQSDRTRTRVEKAYRLGNEAWLHARHRDGFSHDAWRLVGFGEASSDQAVVDRINQAPGYWRETHLNSQAALAGLSPALRAVDAPWGRPGDFDQWIKGWKGSTPSHYLRQESSFNPQTLRSDLTRQFKRQAP
jgi:hypothetical protein